MRITALPGAKTLTVWRLPAERFAGLGMVAEFVEDDVLNEDPCDPWLVKPRMQADQLLVTAIAAEADMRQPSMGLPGPADPGQRQSLEPGRVDPPKFSLEIKRGGDGGQIERRR